jgi:hypothetical protein
MHDDVHIRVMVTRGIKKTPSQDPRLTISGPNLVIIAEYKKAAPSTKEKNFSLFDVYGADEAFVTGTFGGLTPVTKIDSRTIGTGLRGLMTQRLSNLYEDLIAKAVS